MNAQTEPKPSKNYAENRGDDAVASLTDVKTTPPDTEQRQTRRRHLRRTLLLGGPIVVIVAGTVLWLMSGRYVGTEDAYVKADKVTVSAETSGPITQVTARENQRVRAGEELFRIDDRPYRIALAKADAQMLAVVADISGMKASYQQKIEELQLARTNSAFAEREYQRQLELSKQHLNSRVQLDDAKHKLDIARQQISVTEQEQAQYLTRLNGNASLPATAHPNYLEAKAARDSAALDIERSVVHAPFDGVASKVPQLGQYINSGNAVMSVISTDDIWIEANFMETDLTNVHVGQSVQVEVDTYPGREWSGQVQSISQATGAEFSVLPPQNASGNWVKIVQRIPLRIAIKPEANDPPLRVGMTASVKIDTGEKHKLKKLLHRDTASPAQASATVTPEH